MQEITIENGPGTSGGATSHEHLLVRELTHRIDNEFTSIIGLISRSASRSTSDEVKSALLGVINLLHNYAGVQRTLRMPKSNSIMDAREYIRALCQTISLTHLDSKGIELVFIEHPVQMHSEQCWKLGMILSELIMNSARHAFADRGGRIRVELMDFGSFVHCCVEDNGSSKGPFKPGEGLSIVDELARSLGGEIVHGFGVEGAMSRLIFPVNCSSALQPSNGR